MLLKKLLTKKLSLDPYLQDWKTDTFFHKHDSRFCRMLYGYSENLICYLVFGFVGCVYLGLVYLTPFVFSYLIRWRLYEGCKRITDERKKEKRRRYLLNFNFIFWGLIRLFCSEEMSFWTTRKTIANKVLKCTSGFRWVISPKSAFLAVGDKSRCRFFFFYVYAAARGDTVLRQVRDLGGYVHCLLAAEGKKDRLVSKVKLKWGWVSF